jgi:hypothetical protein
VDDLLLEAEDPLRVEETGVEARRFFAPGMADGAMLKSIGYRSKITRKIKKKSDNKKIQ